MYRLCVSLAWLTACGDSGRAVPDGMQRDGAEVPDAADVVEADRAGDGASAAPDLAIEVAPDGVAAEIDTPVAVPLVNETLWVRVPDAEDPFFAARPAGLVCDPTGILIEAGTLEIKTGLCDWPTLEQPLLADVAASDTIEVIFFFGPLLAPEPGQALVEMRFGGELLWQKTFAIPSTGGFVIQNIIAPRAFAAGEQALFHLHNHGANTWNLASVAVLGSE